MITPADIRQRAQRWWDDQSFLRSYLAGDDYFAQPKSIGRIGLDDERTLLANFARIADEQETLRRESRERLGYGYTLYWQSKSKQKLGGVRLVQRITFDTPIDWLRYIGREADFSRFVDLVAQTRQQVPELEPWLHKYPLRLLEHANDWLSWLVICRFFLDTYVPDRYYVRQLPLPVHTKFLEEKNNLLLGLLSVLKPTLLQPDQKDWRKKLGLLVPEPMIRVRALDERLRLDGLHEDFGLPLSAFAAHTQPAQRVFICENLLNFLTLPTTPDAIAVWSGGGFNIECLADVAWLRERKLYYWGDLDAHGFQILNQCRKHFPNTQSLLMNQATFDVHQHLVSEGEPTKVTSLPYLTEDEFRLFNLLKRNNWRVEQERLGVDWVRKQLAQIS